MSDQPTANPYLDRTLETFRSAVKAWSRDSTIVVLLFLATGMLTVLPLIHWYEKEQTIQLHIEENRSKRSQIEGIIVALQDIQGQVARTKKGIERYGSRLAGELSKNLSRFGNAVRNLKQRDPKLPDPSLSFPGSSMAEQFDRPAVSPVERDPKTVLAKTFNLSEAQIEGITSSERGSPQWTEAARTVKKVFDTEIDKTYQRLNERVAEGHKKLMQLIRKILDSVRPAAEEMGLQLPTSEKVIRPMEPIPRPPDDAVFRSRAGKFRALHIETLKIAVDLDAAVEPLNLAHTRIIAMAKNLDQSLEALKTKQSAVEKEITALEEKFTEVEAQLAQISQPLKWLPLAVDTFVRFYPTFFSVLFFILAMRVWRLSALRKRLRQELINRNVPPKDISLALLVPESTLDIFGDPGSGTWLNRGIRLAAPAALVAFLVGTAWRIETSPVYTTTLPRILNATTVAICAIVFLVSAKDYFRDTGPRKRADGS